MLCITTERRLEFATRLTLAAAFAAAVATAPVLAAETPKRGGTLTYMIAADAPPSFDGHREQTYALIHPVAPFYSVLIRINPENPASSTDFVCDLCTEMPTPTDDGKTYTFKIRAGRQIPRRLAVDRGRRRGELEPDRLPARGRHQRPLGELQAADRKDREPGPGDGRLPPEIRDLGVPAGARRSVQLHLQEGNPRQGSALVRKEHHRLRPVQVRRL